MIINCGTRRIVSYKYGWKIEALKTNQKTGVQYWDEDRPAWPASLSDALENVFERIVKEGGEITPSELTASLRGAAVQVRHYAQQAREAA